MGEIGYSRSDSTERDIPDGIKTTGEFAALQESPFPAIPQYSYRIQGGNSHGPCSHIQVLQGKTSPYASRGKVEEELEQLTKEGIVEPI